MSPNVFITDSTIICGLVVDSFKCLDVHMNNKLDWLTPPAKETEVLWGQAGVSMALHLTFNDSVVASADRVRRRMNWTVHWTPPRRWHHAQKNGGQTDICQE